MHVCVCCVLFQHACTHCSLQGFSTSSADLLPGEQSTGAIQAKALAKLPRCCFVCLSVISPFSWFTLQASVAFCGSLGKKDSLSAPEASLHARLFRKAYFIIAQGSASQLDVNSQAV